MKQYFPKPNTGYLQTNRSDELGSLWSSFNLDFQKNLGSMKLSDKLVTNTTATSKAGLGVAGAFEFFHGTWWAICGSYMFKNSSSLSTSIFSKDTNSGYFIGDATTRFDITNPSGTTFRYTYDGTGTNPSINTSSFPIGSSVNIWGDNFHSSNNLNTTVTGSGSNYFEITNAGGTAENDKTLGTDGFIAVSGGSRGSDFNTYYSDLNIFNQKIWATTENDLWSKDRYYSASGGWGQWTRRGRLGSGIHKMTYLEKRDRLYFVDDIDTISSIDKTNSLANSTGSFYLNLDNENLAIRTIEASSEDIWVGTSRVDGSTSAGSLAFGSKGVIYQWDGISAQVSKSYPLTTAGVLAMCIAENIPYAVDTEGRILKYTGYSFEEIQRFPILNIAFYNSTNSNPENKFIHYNGMVATKNNTILFAINNNLENNGIYENIPSGLWELDLTTNNLTHKYSITLTTLGSSTVVDFGQNRISSIGAIKINSLANSSSSAGRGNLFVGAEYYTTATVKETAILIDSPKGVTTDDEGQKRGYFVTTWYESPEVESTWTKLWTIYKRFKNSTDKIIFKYRLEEEDPIEATITWTSTSTFTTTTNISDYAGYEAEIIQGTGSGACTNITSVTELAGTYTATIDTAITGVTGTAKARFQKWKKIYPVASGTVKSYTEMPFNATNVRIQIKGILEWTGDGEFSKFILMDDEDIISNL